MFSLKSQTANRKQQVDEFKNLITALIPPDGSELLEDREMVPPSILNPEPYRGTSLIRNTHPYRITIGPQVWGYCKVLRGAW